MIDFADRANKTIERYPKVYLYRIDNSYIPPLCTPFFPDIDRWSCCIRVEYVPFRIYMKKERRGGDTKRNRANGNCIRIFRLLIYQTVFQLLNRLTSLSPLHTKIAGIFLRFENSSNVPRASLKQREMSLKKIPCWKLLYNFFLGCSRRCNSISRIATIGENNLKCECRPLGTVKISQRRIREKRTRTTFEGKVPAALQM